ncbi:MAG: Na-translocating system protein MpsB, partial [Gammaproteobacteria bacterium]
LLHELKESVLTPYVTVEAIGMLFGFDMIGKTLIPQGYNRWRQRIYREKPATHLLLDKLDREQADSIVRAVQRAVVAKAVEQEIGLKPEEITDDMVRELREAALDNATSAPSLREASTLGDEDERLFIQRLRNVYRIDPAFARLQMEQVARIGFSLEEQTNFVAQALSSIGLRNGMSRFVLLVGHGSTSENNPYESALDCGACGGNHGLTNAKALAHMANRAQVRSRLRYQGIIIPDDTWFIPAMHDTVSDEIRLHELERLPSSHVVYLDRLRNGLTAASRLCAQERLRELRLDAAAVAPGKANREARRNAMDWSQVRPEWGLSGNAYFIIGRRDLTRDFALHGRAFLHSYDYRTDPRRRLLETILTGPLVVGQWINMEHYFSTVDNECFGSGSKVYHNVAGRFGVMTGNLSDLRTGLPAQTVLDRGRPYHQPIRLVTVIEAPFEHAWRSIEEVTTVKHLVRNGWIRLMIVDPEEKVARIYDNDDWISQPLSVDTTASQKESIEP